MDINWTRGKAFYEFNYWIYLHTIGPWVRKKFNYKSETFTPKSKTFLALVNHTNDLDPFFFAMMFPKYARYVAAENILRKPVTGFLVSFLQKPVPRKKGAPGSEVSKLIRDNLKSGISILMFPEGVRTINGRTGYISPKTADLLKDTGAGLITCRVYGGYLNNPLWATNHRKGDVWAQMVHEYTAEELSGMSRDEIYKAICDDLYINAYDVQREKMIPYPGPGLAEGLENVVYLCPKCLKFDGLVSDGDSYKCRCGFELTLDEYGFFQGENLPFDNVCSWETWQREKINEFSALWSSEKDLYICSQNNVYLTRLNENDAEILIENAKLTLNSDAILLDNGIESLRFPLSEISEVSNFRSTALIFSSEGKRYEVRHGESWPVFKYIAFIRLLSGKKYL